MQPGAASVTQAMERVSDTVYKSSIKVGGQVIATALNELSSDGKTLTATTTGIGQFAVLSEHHGLSPPVTESYRARKPSVSSIYVPQGSVRNARPKPEGNVP